MKLGDCETFILCVETSQNHQKQVPMQWQVTFIVVISPTSNL
jgi:hypothetical protein